MPLLKILCYDLHREKLIITPKRGDAGMHDIVMADATKQTGPDLVFLFMMALAWQACTIATSAHAATDDSPPDIAAWHDVDLPSDGGNRLQLFAQNLGDQAPSAASVGYHHDGVGASGAQARAPSIRAETGFDPVSGVSEHLFIQFGQHVTRAELLLTYFYPNEVEIGGVSYNEQGGWRAFRGTRQVDEGRFTSNANNGNYRLTVATQTPFDRLEFFATPYVSADGAEIAPGRVLTDSSDFLIKHIAYQALQENAPMAPPSESLKTGEAAGDLSTHTARQNIAAD